VVSSAHRRLSLIGAAVVCAGCVTGRATLSREDAGRDWPGVVAQAEADARARRYAEADKVLADFAQRYPSAPEAAEASYWRGVFALDPSNRDGSPQVAGALFEWYLKSDAQLQHRVEAEVLRRVASRLDALSQSAGATAAVTTGSVPPAVSSGTDLKAKDAEIQKLKDELAKANDELERIKRRLTAPTKP